MPRTPMMFAAFAAFAAAATLATPALAQMQPSGTQTDQSTSTGSMQAGSMGNSMMPKMSASQMRSMKKCQAMTSDMMAKNKSCTKMMKMHPEMMNSGGM